MNFHANYVSTSVFGDGDYYQPETSHYDHSTAGLPSPAEMFANGEHRRSVPIPDLY
jgi:hypothetical protein